MSSQPRALTSRSLGAWLVKARGDAEETAELVRTGFAGVRTRCVRRSYRTDLVVAGQPVLLWVSGGGGPSLPSGLYAQGWTTGHVRQDQDDATSAGPSRQLLMPVALEPLARPVPRREILEHPTLSGIEVVRMPAGANPSFLTTEQLNVLRHRWPQVRLR